MPTVGQRWLGLPRLNQPRVNGTDRGGAWSAPAHLLLVTDWLRTSELGHSGGQGEQWPQARPHQGSGARHKTVARWDDKVPSS